MKARSAAREIALLALFQLEKKGAKLDAVALEKQTLQTSVLTSVRVLSEMAQDQIETIGHQLVDLQTTLLNHELSHPDNEKLSLDEPLQPVPIPTTREMSKQLETILDGLENLQDAYQLATLNALSGREDVENYYWMLVRTVARHQAQIDTHINSVSTQWPVERLQKMDLTLLRLGIAELLYAGQADNATVVEEVLQLAGRFTDEDGRKFIHGLLAQIITDAQPQATSQNAASHV